ncbi:DUF4381 domain-containing protein [Sulfurirhabdus autotrophica]|uniref:Uncharacterized protein DUF4381 n=1 Tax=Sulfurirhabdus autotrophica TaxID=1706046 RepID=A0A4R3YBY1_9PROT|nr:DUF4381 domain-containing protein [Sulfurirhabdus autotrophica]TCV89496.1 uncharacterized protein DUF4381 [Sulfurirhabdus autotrophica]
MVENNTDWLSKLAPPHAPTPAGWWPPAPGWWALALILLIISGIIIYRNSRHKTHLSRIALRELKQLESTSINDVQLASELEHLMRRYALAIYGREYVANLSGDTWLAFIASHGAKEMTGEAGKSFLCAAYGSQVKTDRTQWLQGARNFLRRY